MARRKSLTLQVSESLAEKIHSGALLPGSRLPTEAELCGEYEVSRTVIREALAQLRSAGLVLPQQGRGIFVAETPSPQSFLISEEDLQSLPETIALLELRLSVEVEAAGLCADRRSDPEAAELRRMMEEIDHRHPDPRAVKIHYDYDFHLQIARGARNDLMLGFLEYLRPFIQPRYQLANVVQPDLQDSYYALIHAEHEAIVAAIERRDADAARQAMRGHLVNSLERVRALAPGLGGKGTAMPTAAMAGILAGFVRPAG